MTALWTGTVPPPQEYVELVLCRDVYHCTPSELGNEDWDVIELHLEMMAAEGLVRKMET